MSPTNHQHLVRLSGLLLLLLASVGQHRCHDLHVDDHEHHHMPAAAPTAPEVVITQEGSSQPAGAEISKPMALQQEQQPTTTSALTSTSSPTGQIHSTKPKEESTSPLITITTDPKQLFATVPEVIIDLSHPLKENQTLYWPTIPSGFRYESYTDGERQNERNESYYLKSDGFRMGIHCGTHLDAPRHFSKQGWTVEQIPLERLINVPVTVIDVSEQVSARRDYSFVKSDFFTKDTNQSLVSPNSVVLMYTGISKLYADGAEAYFGTSGKNISEMSIPGFSQEAAEYLASVGVFGVGLDAASADSSEKHGWNSTIDPVAHKIFNGNNMYILENVSNRLAELLKQNNQMSLVIAPLPIAGASGSPVRLIAVSSPRHSDSAPFTVNSAVSTSMEISLLIPSIITLVIVMLAQQHSRRA